MIQTLFCPDASSKAIFIIPDRDFGYKTVNPDTMITVWNEYPRPFLWVTGLCRLAAKNKWEADRIFGQLD